MKKVSIWTIILFFTLQSIGINYAWSQALIMPASLPSPGQMIPLSPLYRPALLKGIKTHLDNPFQFDFILDKGQSGLGGEQLSQESSKLIKYFLAALTIPEKDMWVNLSPYEKDRIIPTEFGETEMGRDLLAQDYLLKQVTSSLIYPENELGEAFWEKVYEKAYKTYGTMDIAVSTFNKVWIIPESAEVYENGDTALIVDCHLKVLTEFDYLAQARTQEKSLEHLGMKTAHMTEQGKVNESLSNEILRELVIPAIEKEVNKGKNFTQLRQIYHSLILATWFKRNLKESILSKVYVGKNKIDGVNIDDKEAKLKIYEQYLSAFKKGVFNYIKEDYDPRTQQIIPRKYFSGGAELMGPAMDRAMMVTTDLARGELAYNEMDQAMIVTADLARTDTIKEEQPIADRLEETPSVLAPEDWVDAAMLGKLKENIFDFLGRRNKAARTGEEQILARFDQDRAVPLEYYGPYRRLFRAKGQSSSDVMSVLNDQTEMKKRVMISFSNIKPQRLDFLIERQSSSIEQSVLELVSNASDALTGRKAPIGRFGFGALQMLAFVLDENNPALANGAHVIVDTAAEAGKGRRIIFFKGNDGQIYFQTEAIAKAGTGTKVSIQFPQGLPDQLKSSIQAHLRQRLNLFTKMKVTLNGEVVNTLAGYQYLNGNNVGYEHEDTTVDIQVNDFEISIEDFGEGMSDDIIFNKYLIPRLGQNQAFQQTPEEIAQDVHIFYRESQYSQEARKSRIVFQVSGVNIQEETIEGYNLPEEMIIQLPASTLLTTSRDTIEIDDSTHTAVRALAEKIMNAQYSKRMRNSLINGFVRSAAIADEKNGRTKVSQSLVDKVKETFLKSLLDLDVPILPNEPAYHEIVSSEDTIFLEPELMYKLTPEQIPGATTIKGFKKGRFKKAFFVPFKEDSQLTYLPLGPYLLFNREIYDRYKDSPLPLNFRLNFYVGYGPRQASKGRILSLEEAASIEEASVISLLEEHKNLSSVVLAEQMEWLESFWEGVPQQRKSLKNLLTALDQFIETLPKEIKDQMDEAQWREVLPFNPAAQDRVEELMARPQMMMNADERFLKRHMTFFLNRDHPERLERYLSNLLVANGLSDLTEPDILHSTLTAVDAKALRFLGKAVFEKVAEVFEEKDLQAYEEAFQAINDGLDFVEEEGINRLIIRWLRVYDLDPKRAENFRQKMARVYAREAPIQRKVDEAKTHQLKAGTELPDQALEIIFRSPTGEVTSFTRNTGVEVDGLPVFVAQYDETEVVLYTYDKRTRQKSTIAQFSTTRTWTISDFQWTGIYNENNQYVFVVSDRNSTTILGLDVEEPDIKKRLEVLSTIPFSEIGQEVKQKISILKNALPGKVLVALLGDFEVSFLEMDQETGSATILKNSKIAAGMPRTNADFIETGLRIDGKQLFTLKRDIRNDFFLLDEKAKQFIPYQPIDDFIQKGKIGSHPHPVRFESGETRLVSYRNNRILSTQLFPEKPKKIRTKSSSFEIRLPETYIQIEGLNDSAGRPVVVAYDPRDRNAVLLSLEPNSLKTHKLGEINLGQAASIPRDTSVPLYSIDYLAKDTLLMFNTGYGAMMFDLDSIVESFGQKRERLVREPALALEPIHERQMAQEDMFPEIATKFIKADADKRQYFRPTSLVNKLGEQLFIKSEAAGLTQIYSYDAQTKETMPLGILDAEEGATVKYTGIHDEKTGIALFTSLRRGAVRFHFYDYVNNVEKDPHDFQPEPSFGTVDDIVPTNMGDDKNPVFAIFNKSYVKLIQMDFEKQELISGSKSFHHEAAPDNFIMNVTATSLSREDKPVFVINRGAWDQYVMWNRETGAIELIKNAARFDPGNITPTVPYNEDTVVATLQGGYLAAMSKPERKILEDELTAPDEVDSHFYNVKKMHTKPYGQILNLVALEGLRDNKGNPVFAAFTIDNQLLIFKMDPDIGGKIKIIKNITAGLVWQGGERHIHFNPQTGLMSFGASAGLAIFDLKDTFKKEEVTPTPTPMRLIAHKDKLPEKRSYSSQMIIRDKPRFIQPTGLLTKKGDQVYLGNTLGEYTDVFVYKKGRVLRRIGDSLKGNLKFTKWTGFKDTEGRAIFSSLLGADQIRMHYFNLDTGQEDFYKDYTITTSFGTSIEDVVPTNLGTADQPIFAIRNRMSVMLLQLDRRLGTFTEVSDTYTDLSGSIMDVTASHLVHRGDPVFIINGQIKDVYVKWNRTKQKIEVLKEAFRHTADPLTRIIPLTAGGQTNRAVSATQDGRIMIFSKAEDKLRDEEISPMPTTDLQFYRPMRIDKQEFKHFLHLNRMDGLADEKGNPVFAGFTIDQRLILFSVDIATDAVTVLKEYDIQALIREDVDIQIEGKIDIQFNTETGTLSLGSHKALSVLDLSEALTSPRDITTMPDQPVTPAPVEEAPEAFDLREALSQRKDHRLEHPSQLMQNNVLLHNVRTVNKVIEFSQTTDYVTTEGEQVFIEKVFNEPPIIYGFHPQTKKVREIGRLSEEDGHTYWFGDMVYDQQPVFVSIRKTGGIRFNFFNMDSGKIVVTQDYNLEKDNDKIFSVKKTSLGTEMKPIFAVLSRSGMEFAQIDLADGRATRVGDPLFVPGENNPVNDYIEWRQTNLDLTFVLDRDKSTEHYRFMKDLGEIQEGQRNDKSSYMLEIPYYIFHNDRGEGITLTIQSDGRVLSVPPDGVDSSDKQYGKVRKIFKLDGLRDKNDNQVFALMDANDMIGFFSVANDGMIEDLEHFYLEGLDPVVGRMGTYWTRDVKYNPLTGLLSLSSDAGIAIYDIKSILLKESRDDIKVIGEVAPAPIWKPSANRSGFQALDQRDDDFSGFPAAVRNIVRFLKEEDIDFIEEEELDARGRDWKTTRRLQEPVSLAMVNFIFEFYAQEIDANPNITFDEMVALLEENKDVELQDYIDTMVSAIAGQDKTQHAWVREMIQNARDAMRNERELGRLAPETGSVDMRNFTNQGQWVYSIRDLGGMNLWKLLRYYFPLDQSSKDFLKDTGNLGQGNYTLFADFDQVFIRTSTGDGIIHEILIEPDAEKGPMITQWEQLRGEYKGTEIRKIKMIKTSDPQLESLFIQDAMEHYTGAIQSPATRRAQGETPLDRDMTVRYKGETYSEKIQMTSGSDLGNNWGTLRVGRGQELFRRRVIQDEIFVKSPDQKELKFVPEWLVADFERYGSLHISIPKNILLNIPRTGYSREYKFLHRLQVAVLHNMMRTVLLDSFDKPGEIFGMPPGYFGAENVQDEPMAREIAELMAAGKYNEVTEDMLRPYITNPVRFFELLSHVLFEKEPGKETSLFEIREALLEEAEIRKAREGLEGRQKKKFRDLFKSGSPTGSMGEFIKEVAGEDVFTTGEVGGTLRRVQEVLQKKEEFDVNKYITPEAKLRFDYISRLLVKTITDYGETSMPPLNYFYRPDTVEAHTVNHERIEWNLYNMANMINELDRLAQDPQEMREALRLEENSVIWNLMEVVLHEPGHLARWHKPGGHTHHHQEEVDEGFASNMGKFIDAVLKSINLFDELTRSPEYMQEYLQSEDQAMLTDQTDVKEDLGAFSQAYINLSSWQKTDFMLKGQDIHLRFRLFSTLSEEEQEALENDLMPVLAEQALMEEEIDGVKKDALIAFIEALDEQGQPHINMLGSFVLDDLDGLNDNGQANEGGMFIKDGWKRSRVGMIIYDKALSYLQAKGLGRFRANIYFYR